MKRLVRAAALAVAIILLFGSLGAEALASARGDSPRVAQRHVRYFYLALGDSLAAGHQPDSGDHLRGGYAGWVLPKIRLTHRKTRLVNLACSGETTTTLVQGGICSYPAGNQLAQAVRFASSHPGRVRTITLDIGANDVQRCVTRDSDGTPNGVDMPCVMGGLQAVDSTLPSILSQLKTAAPEASIHVLNYYNPFLAAYLAGPSGQQLAQMSVALQSALNNIIAGATTAAGAKLVDIATAFQSTDWTPADFGGYGTLPTNVGTICTDTWMCSKADIHANPVGYKLMGQTVAATLP